MHIGVFTYYYYPVINGVVLTIGDWKKQAERSGIPMTVFTSRADWKKSTDPDVVEYPSIRLYKKLGLTIPMFPASTIEKEIMSRRITLLHVHHPFYIGRLACDIKEKFHLPIVFTYHTRYTDYVRTYFPSVVTRFVNLIVTGIVVRFMNACDAVTVASESLKYELADKGVRTPIYIVPPGIDTKKFKHGNRTVLRKRYGISTRDTAILYVGRLAKEKNIYFLLRAFLLIHRRMPSTRLLLVGNGLEEERIAAYVRRKHVADVVHIVTDRTPKNIEDAYAAADIFVYASQTETFGRVLVEAMAAGLPIVALNGPSITDLIADGINGVKVYRKSVRVFAGRVADVLNNPSRAESMGQQGQKDACEHFDNSISWSRLLEVYTAVEGKPREV
ncbi:MAG: glycosyltransferase [Candidatus Gottesmanbacteria bacterium]|nr:glycosyltransferase [Candidatus Gottesmanbacteria bacterium]